MTHHHEGCKAGAYLSSSKLDPRAEPCPDMFSSSTLTPWVSPWALLICSATCDTAGIGTVRGLGWACMPSGAVPPPSARLTRAGRASGASTGAQTQQQAMGAQTSALWGAAVQQYSRGQKHDDTAVI